MDLGKKIEFGCGLVGLIFLVLIIWWAAGVGEENRKIKEAQDQRLSQYPIIVRHGGVFPSKLYADSIKWIDFNLHVWTDGSKKVFPKHRVKEVIYK